MSDTARRKPRIYIASPYTKGDTALNVRAQIHAAEALIEKGYIPYVPLLTHFWHVISPHEHEYWMQLDIAWLETCDAVLRLPGESAGADREVDYALAHGKPVYYGLDEVPDPQ